MSDYGANREKTPELSESGAVLLIVPYIFDNLILQITDSRIEARGSAGALFFWII